ncbi:MAG TPA: SDR family oxidoreductase [Pyrinomonadaceae bacterium]
MPGQSFRGFAEKVALVTDGASPTGRAVALQLALEGAYVIVGYGEAETEGERVARELREIGTLAHAVRADAWHAQGVRRLFAAVEEAFGRLDLLVNSAHREHQAALDDLTEDAWDEVLAVNLKSAFLCTQAALPLMRKRPKPAIVNLASEAGLTAGAGEAHYVASQAGLIGLTRALARTLGPRIRVNCVAQAIGLGGEHQGPQGEHAREAKVGRPPLPDETARACIYLLSSDASAVTGQTLVVAAR